MAPTSVYLTPGYNLCFAPVDSRSRLSSGGHRAMKTVLWALGLGTLLLTLRAVPIGKFLLPSSVEASGGRGSVEPETLGCGDLLL